MNIENLHIEILHIENLAHLNLVHLKFAQSSFAQLNCTGEEFYSRLRQVQWMVSRGLSKRERGFTKFFAKL